MNNNINEIENIIQEFKSKYGENEYYTKDFGKKVVDWLNNTDEKNTKNILLELLRDFRFFTKIEIKDILLKQLEDSLKQVDLESTNILPLLSPDGRVNSSYEMVMLIKEIARENEIKLYTDTLVIDNNNIEDYISHIILFDDISGTGRTIIKFLNNYKDLVVDRKIIINLLVITESAEKAIIKYLEENKEYNFDITIKAEYKFNKVFETIEKYNDSHREELFNFERNIWGDGNNNILGYKDSQILVGFSHNIPNNTISSFWFDPEFKNYKVKWNTLFKRSILMKRQPARERKVQNKIITEKMRR